MRQPSPGYDNICQAKARHSLFANPTTTTTTTTSASSSSSSPSGIRICNTLPCWCTCRLQHKRMTMFNPFCDTKLPRTNILSCWHSVNVCVCVFVYECICVIARWLQNNKNNSNTGKLNKNVYSVGKCLKIKTIIIYCCC